MAAMLAIVGGGLWLCLWQRRWRWLGLGPIAAGFLAVVLSYPPDVLLARDARSAAVRDQEGHLVLLANKLDDYTASQWLQRDGDARDVEVARQAGQCDDNGCVAVAVTGELVALSLRVASLRDDCARATILLAAEPVRLECPYPRLVLDRFDVAREGAVAVYLRGGAARVETVAQTRGRCPWTRNFSRNGNNN